MLTRAQDGFDIFLTTDQNLPHQQNIGAYSIAVVILRAKSNRLDDLRPLVAELLAKVESCQRGTVTTIGSA